MPTHDHSSQAAVHASVEFTKQLALSFVAIVLMLFIVVSERSRHTPQYASAAGVKGVTDQRVTAQSTQTKKANDAWAAQQVLTCEMCAKHGKKTLCMEPGRKMSYCSDTRTPQSTGGVCVVCGDRLTGTPKPTRYPMPSPVSTCPVPDMAAPPEGCYYRMEKCYEAGCSPCPTPKLVCREGTPTLVQ